MKTQGPKARPAVRARAARELSTEELLRQMEADDEAVRKLRELIAARGQEELLDEIMDLLVREIRHKTLKRLDPAGRTAAARLLLKRGDQRRFDRHQDFVETQAKKKDPPPPPVLTEEEKEQRIKEILGVD